MYLVHERKKKPGTWEVAWTWLPQFLGADPALVKDVDKQLTACLTSQEVAGLKADDLCSYLSVRACEIIQKKYPIVGLRRYLDGLRWVEPEEKCS
jgi:hypothetical protein